MRSSRDLLHRLNGRLAQDFSTLHGVNAQVLNEANEPLVFQVAHVHVVRLHVFNQGISCIGTCMPCPAAMLDHSLMGFTSPSG